MDNGYKNLKVYYGDIHNHCGISYGQGKIEDAFKNARLQLDFCSVTGHGCWADMPRYEKRLKTLVNYHKKGFAKLKKNWKDVKRVTEANNHDGEFVTFLGYEWHCMRSGDYTIIYKGSEGDIILAKTLADLKKVLIKKKKAGIDAIVMPHHISYPAGYRGINWMDFTSNFCPVVEIISMHGCSESDDAPYPPLHTMGPRDYQGTAQYGLSLGHIFGFCGNTDHHSAHPGSYGCGRTGVWADVLTRGGIWEAIQSRRTYALTGDRIDLQFSVNGNPMGRVIHERTIEREIRISAIGGGPINYAEIIKNNKVVYRIDAADHGTPYPVGMVKGKLFVEVGWGRKIEQRWNVKIELDSGEIIDVEPRFRGEYVAGPKNRKGGEYQYSAWQQKDKRTVQFKTKTNGNPTVLTNASQGMLVEIEMPAKGKIIANINGKRVEYTLRELFIGSRSGYLGGFVTAAYRFHRVFRPKEYEWHFVFHDVAAKIQGYDFYYVRVCQKNGQWAWSSPIWVA